jgi:hypothetical protein
MPDMRVPPSQSPDRNTFQRDAYVARQEEEGHDVSDEYIAILESIREQNKNKWADPKRCENNLEYDLVTTDWILEKVRASRSYAQNLYAALCNNQFRRNAVWPLLKGENWGCSWRYAGGIIADMRQEGDYIDWYCSGIRNDYPLDDDGFAQLDKPQQELYIESKLYVNESVITDEVREDLFQLGWLVVDGDEEV